MDANLKFFLENQPTNVKELARLTGRSQTWVRTELKKHVAEIKCRKDTSGQNVFWIERVKNSPETTVEPTPEPEATVTPDPEIEARSDGPDAPHCPLCHSTEPQAPAGEEGTFLGACNTCPDCGKTYNAITGQEVKDAPKKGKRTILNPQYKIRAKTEAVEAAGGQVQFDKADRAWLIHSANGKDVTPLTAQEFANHTPETLAEMVKA